MAQVTIIKGSKPSRYTLKLTAAEEAILRESSYQRWAKELEHPLTQHRARFLKEQLEWVVSERAKSQATHEAP